MITRDQAEVGRTYYVIGCDMACRSVPTRVTLHKIRTEQEAAAHPNGYDCVTKSSGILVMGHLRRLFRTKREATDAIKVGRASGELLR